MTELKPIPIPSSIADVTPDLCQRVFVDIVGAKIETTNVMNLCFPEKGNDLWEFTEIYVFADGTKIPTCMGNPFTNIQDTKLLDKWLVENGLGMVVVLRKATKLLESDETRYVFDVQIGSTKKRKINFTTVRHTAKTEEMARACAVIEAYNKLKGDK